MSVRRDLPALARRPVCLVFIAIPFSTAEPTRGV